MKKARMNISHPRFILFKLKIFGEIVTTFNFSLRVCKVNITGLCHFIKIVTVYWFPKLMKFENGNFRIKSFIVLTLLLEACNEFAGHISASLSLRLQATLLLSKNVEAVASRWQHRVRFHPPKIWISNLSFQNERANKIEFPNTS